MPAPDICVPETVMSNNFTISWQPKNNQFAQSSQWEVQELSGYSVCEDDFEGLLTPWVRQGFVTSTVRAYSGTKSMYSDSANNMSNYLRTAYPYLVNSGDSLTFWCWYNLEKNYDVAVVEVSYDTREWFQLGPRLTDTATSWRRIAYSLEQYVGKSIYIQFRVMTDGSVLRNGFFVDNVYPVPLFNNSRIVSSSITDTFCDISVNQSGQYWYRVKGYNQTNGWGEYSLLGGVLVLSSAVNEQLINPGKVDLKVLPNPFVKSTVVEYEIPYDGYVKIRVFDIQGRLISTLMNNRQLSGRYRLHWQDNHKLAKGIYFVEMDFDKTKLKRRVIII